jgi:hypothetical protein
MGRLGNHAIKDEKKIGMRERSLAFDRISESSHTASHSTRNQKAIAVAADFGEKRLKLPAYARQI